jgi:hypothetical protein
MENYKTTISNSNIYPGNFIQPPTLYHDPRGPTKAKMTTNK